MRSPPFLAIGDSWLWYPVSNPLADVNAVVKPGYWNIMALGYLGAKLEEYVHGKFAGDFARELRPGLLPIPARIAPAFRTSP